MRLSGWRWSWRRRGWRRGRHRRPAPWASRNIGVVTRRVLAVIPERLRRRAGRKRLHHHGLTLHDNRRIPGGPPPGPAPIGRIRVIPSPAPSRRPGRTVISREADTDTPVDPCLGDARHGQQRRCGKSKESRSGTKQRMHLKSPYGLERRHFAEFNQRFNAL